MLTMFIFIFYTALFSSLLVTGKSPQIAEWLGAIDHPDERKAHQHVVSRLGGIGIAAALFISLLLFMPLNTTIVGFLCGGLIIVGTGLWDDAQQISPRIKFVGQVAAVMAFLLIADVRLYDFGDLFGMGHIRTGVLALPITVVCMVGVINALNLSDGLDGLAGGISAIAVLFMSILAYDSQNWVAMAITISLFAAVMGFLRYNAYPAKLFMGDTGSLLLGYCLAALIVLLTQTHIHAVQVHPISIALILALPIVDTLLVMSRRVWHGQSPFLPDKTHLHHRLMDIGFPHAAVVPVMYGIMVVMGVLAIYLSHAPEWLQLMVGLVVMAMFYVLVFYCQHYQLCWRPLQKKVWKENQFFNHLHHKVVSIVGKSTPWFLAFFIITLLLPSLFVSQLPDALAYSLLAFACLFAALFPWRIHHGYHAIVHGLLYLACVGIIFSLNMSHGNAEWISLYLKAASFLVFVWVMLKLMFKRHTEVFLTSGFELLIIFISWFIPMVILPRLHASDELIHMLTTVCIEAVPFFLALKILIRIQPHRNRPIAMGMLCALIVLASHGLIFSA